MGRLTRRGFTLAAAGALSGALTLHRAPSGAADPGRPELRGTWIASVANIDWPTGQGLPEAVAQAQLLERLDNAVRWNLNTVFLQVRPSADALWPSPHEPWSEWLTGEQGRDPGWDPLEFAVTEAHRRGLDLHAWFNPYRIAMHDDLGRLVPGHPARQHPEWVVPYGGRLYYNPGLPEVRAFTQEAMLHAVENYDIDGVHWDDYFYPYPVGSEEFDDNDAFARHGDGFTDRAAWRRNNIDLLVSEMRQQVKRAKPDAAFGISPFAIWRNRSTDPRGSDTQGLETYDALYADTRSWVEKGLLDYIAPQVYWHIGYRAADYAELVRWWAEAVDGTGVRLFIGEAMYKVGDPEQPEQWQDPAELSRHLTLCGEHAQVAGHIFFSASGVADDPLGAMTRVFDDHYRDPVRPVGG
ncbi:family 10 glycosylhydrolase [Streptomyces sp. ACA25]|uniref:glycoside hydrolase family 10 protein n=1 Tax=Streptomyces sp. ACA25 TaxID=3022596 RepID=UPI0023078ACE|nr:family 10 glycosylhydrolase [Streptomyces sp. ACA25]MDB1088986.1 family 10 glycosylhydrolase [Streptomyces sp. ACA25]